MSTDSILIVDDNPDDFFAARRTLGREGLLNPLQHLDSGEKALEWLRTPGHPAPALVLLDINMPGMKGTEVLTELRKDPALEALPVIMLTSSDADRDVMAAFMGRANAYLNKPVTLKSLQDAVARVRQNRPELQLRPA